MTSTYHYNILLCVAWYNKAIKANVFSLDIFILRGDFLYNALHMHL